MASSLKKRQRKVLELHVVRLVLKISLEMKGYNNQNVGFNTNSNLKTKTGVLGIPLAPKRPTLDIGAIQPTSGQADSHSGKLQGSIGSRGHDSEGDSQSSRNLVSNMSSSSTGSIVLPQSPKFGNQVKWPI